MTCLSRSLLAPLGPGVSPEMHFARRVTSLWPRWCCHMPASSPVSGLVWPPVLARGARGCLRVQAGGGQSVLWGRRGSSAAAGWVTRSSFPHRRSLLYCNHPIIMPLKCHIHRNPHKQGISSCQKIVVLLLMTRSPPAAPPLSFFLILFFLPPRLFFCLFPSHDLRGR